MNNNNTNLSHKEILNYCNCMQTALYYFCLTYDIDPFFCLINGFGLEYGNKTGNYIWEIIRLNTPNRLDEKYSNKFGLEIKQILPDFLSFSVDSLFDNSFLIWGDGFFCPWNDAFYKTHISHFCVVTGYDSTTKSFICEDLYLGKHDQKWPIEELTKAPYQIYEVHKKETTNTVSIVDVYSLFENITEETIRNNYQRLICDLRKVEIRTDLFETNTPNVCRVNVCTRQIVDSYRGLAFLFEHFGCQEEKNLLNNAVSIWKQINLMLLKMSFKHTETISGIDSLIELLLKAMELDISIIKLLETNKGG